MASLTVLAIAATAPAAAAISDSEELTKFGGIGSGAGQLNLPWGVATDPVTGHVYVSEQVGSRISEFTPWGGFVKAFGWDVAPGAVNEQQEVRVRAAEGEFKLSFEGDTTGDLDFDAGAAEVEAALNTLPAIGGAGASVSVSAVPGTIDGKSPTVYVVAFNGGSLAGTDVPQLTAAAGTTPPGGGDPSTSLEVRTRADGHAATSGLEACTAELECQAGLEGSGAGQLGFLARGVAVDAAGNLYLREADNRRVQKFDPAGRFVLMFGGEVNKTTSGNLCTEASGDECGIGEPGTGNGQFAAGFSGGIALCSGTLYVADKDRIQRFNPEGVFLAPALPEPGKTVQRLACDPASGDLYATFEAESNVRKLDAGTGVQLGEVELPGVRAIATDAAGNLYAAGPVGEGVGEGNGVLQFNSEGEPLEPPSCCVAALFPVEGLGTFPVEGLGTNAAGDLYVAYAKSAVDSFIRAFGPPPVSFESPPPVPPEITAQFATSVDRTGAVVAAEINPNFWTDTTYHVQYGTGKCSEGGCTQEAPVPPALLTTNAVKAPLKSAGVALEGLVPGTTYHYRFVSESSGGGPVFGIDPDGEGPEEASPAAGGEASFTTFPVPAPPKTDCPNQSFRTGPSASLPDCRAYEMVSPVDKNNGDILSLLDFPSYPTALSRSALDGDKFTYSSYRGFADPEAAPYTNQYLATREEGVGWASESLNVPQASQLEGAFTFDNKYKAFSADLCRGWMAVKAEPVLDPAAPPGYNNVYRRENCGEVGYEALIGVEPSLGKGVFVPILQGTTADGAGAVFQVEDQLTPEAASGVWQAYHAGGGALGLLCVLPGGTASGGNCSAGTGPDPGELNGTPDLERRPSLTHALSADGTKVYWTDSGAKVTGPGKVYLRLNPGAEQSEVSSGECTEPEKACTLKVSETKTTQPSRFLGASADGARALFEVTAGALAGDLYRFDAETASSTLIAGQTLGVLGMSEDLERVYFLSEEALGGDAIPGEPNLYLDEEGTVTFIATLSETDAVEPGLPSNASPEPIYHAARATPDGRVLAFISNESLTGYDNTDQLSGKADSEVYLYEAGSAEPVCVSCNPSGARPVGRVVSYPKSATGLPTAASLTMPTNALYAPRVLSADGSRLFFNSYDALLPRDTNGKADVYEWSSAQSQAACDERGAELYVPSSGGCLGLISTGQSPSDSELLDASVEGEDAFFTTNASLLPQDPGLIDVYDARANGGLPAPPEPPGPCQGEACQLAPPPPNDPTPASASFRGQGNPSVKPRPRCAKGKARRKGRCVKRKRAKGGQSKRAANPNRRQSR